MVFHHGLWHAGQPNPSDVDRWMCKIRLNPSVSQVKRWNIDDFERIHDGTSGAGPQLPEVEPPYPTGLAALQQGWCLIQSPAPYSLQAGAEYEVSYLDNEFVFERRIDL